VKGKKGEPAPFNPDLEIVAGEDVSCVVFRFFVFLDDNNILFVCYSTKLQFITYVQCYVPNLLSSLHLFLPSGQNRQINSPKECVFC